MALALDQQVGLHPLASYNFRVSRAGQTLRFAKVTGLQREFKSVTYRDGLSFLDGERITRYAVQTYSSITLEQGVVQGDGDLRAWLEADELQTMEVQLCDASGVPVLAWRVARSLPVKITAPNFDARSNEVAIEVIEVKVSGITPVSLA
ncbi:MAG: phage tail protein [Cyanobium sp.]